MNDVLFCVMQPVTTATTLLRRCTLKYFMSCVTLLTTATTSIDYFKMDVLSCVILLPTTTTTSLRYSKMKEVLCCLSILLTTTTTLSHRCTMKYFTYYVMLLLTATTTSLHLCTMKCLSCVMTSLTTTATSLQRCTMKCLSYLILLLTTTTLLHRSPIKLLCCLIPAATTTPARCSAVKYLMLLLLTSRFTGLDAVKLEPSFDVPMANVSVKEGKTAILPCSVKFLGRHQVVWTDQWSTLLTFEDRRIIDDERISVERPYTEDWNMHIRSVRHSDQGIYNCQVNTSPVKIKTVDLKVFVPAKILNYHALGDLVVREGDTVTLACNVTGIPMPTVKWIRYKLKSEVRPCKGTNKIGMNGEVLLIYNISRHCGDTYECVADNGVPPSVSRKISVFIEFPPVVKLPNKRIGQEWGKETILECRVTAFPQEITVWTRNHVALTNTVKYRIEIYEEGDNTLTLSLRIKNLQPTDFGTYVCEASNRLGRDTQKMELFDYTAYRMTSTTVAMTTLEPAFNITTNNKQNPRTHFSRKKSSHEVVGVVNDSHTPKSTHRIEPIAPGKALSAPPISQQSGITGLCSGSLMPICDTIADTSGSRASSTASRLIYVIIYLLFVSMVTMSSS